MKSFKLLVVAISLFGLTNSQSQTTRYNILLNPNAGSISQLADDMIISSGGNTYNLNTANISCIQSIVNDDLVYHFSIATDDFDRNGSNDTLSFDIVVKGYTGSTFLYSPTAESSSVTSLGTVSLPKSTSNHWSIGTDGDIDAGESLTFSLQNVTVSSILPNFELVTIGMDSANVIETNAGHTHNLINGIGSGLNSFSFSSNQLYSFDPTNEVTITGAGSYFAETREWAVSQLAFSIKISDPTYVNFTDYSEYRTSASFYGELAEQIKSISKPNFCWDRVPKWMPLRSGTRLSDEVVKRAAENYDLLLLEKHNQQGFANTEEGIRDLSSRLKAVNPDVKTLFYFNSVIFFSNYAANIDFNIPDWYHYTLDSNGDRVYTMIRNSLFTINPELQEVQDWWVNQMLTMANEPNIDGVFIDKMGDGDNGINFNTDGSPANGYTNMIYNLYNQMPPNKMVIGNSLRNERNNGNRQSMSMLDGSYLERWDFPNKDFNQSDAEAKQVAIQLCQEALAKGKMINFRTEAHLDDLQNDLNFKLGVFLILAEENAYFYYGDSIDPVADPDSWDFSGLPEFNYYLGAPLGPATKNGYVYTRSYENVDVTIDVEAVTGTLNWHDTTILPSTIPSLVSGNTWYHNYKTKQYDATVSQVATGVLELAQESPSSCKNPSSKASKFTKSAGNNSFVKFDLPGNITSLSNAIFKLRVYTPSNTTVTNNNLRMFLRNNGDNLTQINVTKSITVFDEWVEYTFDFSTLLMTSPSYNELVLFFAQPDTDRDATGNVYYFDAFQGPLLVALGLENNLLDKNNLTVLPNPVSDNFSLSREIIQAELFNMNGQTVKRFISTQNQYDISDLDSGIYIIKVTLITNETKILKIIKK